MGFWERKIGERGGAKPVPKPQALPPMPGHVPATAPRPTASPAPPASGCPECGSPNYGSPRSGAPPRCFECGFGNAYRNSTDNQPTVRSGEAVKAAKQVPNRGYQPNEIVGRMS